jgi:hypothetical protein
LTEFELNQPTPSSRSSSIINVSNIKTNEVNSPITTFENDTLTKSSSGSPHAPIHNNKKISGHYDQVKHGRDKQLLHQV